MSFYGGWFMDELIKNITIDDLPNEDMRLVAESMGIVMRLLN